MCASSSPQSNSWAESRPRSAIKGMVKAAGDNVGFDLREEDYGYDKLTALFRAPELADVLTLETKDNGPAVGGCEMHNAWSIHSPH